MRGDPVLADLQITLGAEQRGMTQQCLNGSQVHPGFQKMSSKTVPERMNAVAFLDASPKLGQIVDFLGVVDRNRTALSHWEKDKIGERCSFQYARSSSEQPLGQNRVAVFSPLALFHPHHHPFGCRWR